MIRIEQSEFTVYTARSTPSDSDGFDLRVKVVHQDTGLEAIGSDGMTQTVNRNLALRQLVDKLMERYGVNSRPAFYPFDNVRIDAKNDALGHVTGMGYDEVTKEWKYQIEVDGVTDPHHYNADELQILT